MVAYGMNLLVRNGADFFMLECLDYCPGRQFHSKICSFKKNLTPKLIVDNPMPSTLTTDYSINTRTRRSFNTSLNENYTYINVILMKTRSSRE